MTAKVFSCAPGPVPEVTFTLAVYVPLGNVVTIGRIETVVVPGLPGLADPPAGEALIQLAGAEEVSCVAAFHESVPEELVMVTFWGGGTCPEGAVKDKEDGETPSVPVVCATTFTVTLNIAIWENVGP